MRGISRLAVCCFVIFPASFCRAQDFSAVTAASANPVTNDSQEMPAPAANLVNSGSGRPAENSYWPLPYIYGGLGLSGGAGYSPAAGAVGGGLNVDSSRLILLAESSVQNAHKQDSGTGSELDLKGRAFLRASAGWYFGGGAQWSKLSTAIYDKQAWRPAFGGGGDLLRENFSMRAQILYVLPGSDHLRYKGRRSACGCRRPPPAATCSTARRSESTDSTKHPCREIQEWINDTWPLSWSSPRCIDFNWQSYSHPCNRQVASYSPTFNPTVTSKKH
jgi:hypothetical protein